MIALLSQRPLPAPFVEARHVTNLLLWLPRALGIAVALFLALFALDAAGEGIAAGLIHLIPSVAVVVLVVASWNREWIGGIAFVGLAGFYAWRIAPHPGAMLVISGPLLLVGLLFLISWQYHDVHHAH